MGLATAEELGLAANGPFSGRISTAYDSLDPSRGPNSVMQGRNQVLPNTSHGNRNRGGNNRTMFSPVDVGARVTNSLDFS